MNSSICATTDEIHEVSPTKMCGLIDCIYIKFKNS